jgi:molybdopterin converting factor small subunit
MADSGKDGNRSADSLVRANPSTDQKPAGRAIRAPVRVTVCFYSYFKDLTGCAQTSEIVPEGTTLEDLFKKLSARFPKLSAMQKSTLMAVGVDYQDRNYVLKEGDEVSLFPPVQGG